MKFQFQFYCLRTQALPVTNSKPTAEEEKQWNVHVESILVIIENNFIYDSNA